MRAGTLLNIADSAPSEGHVSRTKRREPNYLIKQKVTIANAASKTEGQNSAEGAVWARQLRLNGADMFETGESKLSS